MIFLKWKKMFCFVVALLTAFCFILPSGAFDGNDYGGGGGWDGGGWSDGGGDG